jgi:catechol 2,3-dioxygenase-like lactoylglutathione lyase family enzyme
LIACGPFDAGQRTAASASACRVAEKNAAPSESTSRHPIDFFIELGLELEGRAPVEGDWADRVTGLAGMRVEIAMMRTPDDHSRLELSRFLAPPVVADHRSAPVNALGYLRVMFTVEDIDDTVARLSGRGAKLVGEVVQYQNMYRLCYIRGPEGILIGLAQQLGQQASRENPIGHQR